MDISSPAAAAMEEECRAMRRPPLRLLVALSRVLPTAAAPLAPYSRRNLLRAAAAASRLLSRLAASKCASGVAAEAQLGEACA